MEIKRKVAQSSVQSQPLSNEQGGVIENQKIEIKGQKFTEGTGFIILMFFVFFPYGFYLLWKRGDKTTCKVLAFLFFGLPLIVNVIIPALFGK